MGLLHTIKVWLSLRKAKDEERKHVLTKSEILDLNKDLELKEKKLKEFYVKNTVKTTKKLSKKVRTKK
ncbi:hypothetical protein HZA96_04760 [Candidatus Woesearchaeota archaeon]|nr:hypothetical protein [Candidatus Woesearchaeota archaeon]